MGATHNLHRTPNTRRSPQDPDAFPRRIDITRFAEVGRINRPSGAKSRADYDARVAVLDELWEDRNLDLLRAFQAGEVSMDYLMALKNKKQLDHGVEDLRLRRPLFEMLDEVVPKLGRKKKTRDGYQTLLAKLVSLATPALTERAVVRDLERIDWDATMEAWQATGVSGQSWNNMTIALGSFLSAVVGKRSAARERIMERVPRAATSPGRVPDATVEQLAAVVMRMPRRTGSTALGLLVTGVRMEDFLGLDPEKDLLPNQEAIRVEGLEAPGDAKPFTQSSKNDPSRGIRYVPSGFWPVVEWAARNKPAYVTLRRHWCQACHEVGLGVVSRTKDDPNHRWPQTFRYEGMTMHDLRHSYAQYVSDAGMPLEQLRHALGHADVSSTARYAARLAKKEAAEIAGRAFGAAFTPELLWPDEQDEPDGVES